MQIEYFLYIFTHTPSSSQVSKRNRTHNLSLDNRDVKSLHQPLWINMEIQYFITQIMKQHIKKNLNQQVIMCLLY